MRISFVKMLAIAGSMVLLLTGTASATDVNAVTHLSLRSSSLSVSRGDKVTLSGRLSTVRRCRAHQTIQLWKVHGKMLASTKTNRRGFYHFLRTMRRTTSFRTVFRGSARGVHPNSTVCQGSHSHRVTVKVT